MSFNDVNLLPCPFCGGKAQVFDDRRHPYDTDGHIGCTKCGARINDFNVEAWNKRVNLSKDDKLYKQYAEDVNKSTQQIVERLELEKLYREHVAYSLYRKESRYLNCKSWEECLACAQKDFKDYFKKS